MTTTAIYSTLTIFLSALFPTILARASPLAAGIQLAFPDEGWDIRFPLSVAQCEPVFIYYNYTLPEYGSTVYISVNGPEVSTILLTIDAPKGSDSGYLEWLCDIPAGYSFIVRNGRARHYVVQPGSSSSCLDDVKEIYPYASYDFAALKSYTQNPPYTVSPALPDLASTTVPFPIGSFPTFPVNPDLYTASSSQTLTPSPSMPTSSDSSIIATFGPVFSSSTSYAALFSLSTSLPTFSLETSPATASSRYANTSAIVGGIIGGAVILLLALTILVILLRRRRKHRLQDVIYPFIGRDDFTSMAGRSTPSAILKQPLSVYAPQSALSSPNREAPLLREGTSNFEARTSPITPYPFSPSSVQIRSVSKPGPINLPLNRTTPSTGETRDLQPDVAAALSRISPNTDQGDTLMTLNTDTGTLVDMATNSTIALHSFARLSPEERRAFVSMLQRLMALEPSGSTMPNRTESVITAPPPYGG